jgi:hypothetical protein
MSGSTEKIFLPFVVFVAGIQERLWLNMLFKFLSSTNSHHDCSPSLLTMPAIMVHFGESWQKSFGRKALSGILKWVQFDACHM